VKTDLVASQGVCYAKYDRATAAAHALTCIAKNDHMVRG